MLLYNYHSFEAAKKSAEYYAKLFGTDNFYLEISDHDLEEQGRIKEGILRLAKEVGLGLVATNDVH